MARWAQDRSSILFRTRRQKCPRSCPYFVPCRSCFSQVADIFAQDLAYIQKLVRHVRPADQCPWLLHIEYNPKQSDLDLAAQINASLAKGHPVHITGYPMFPRPEDIKMTAQSIYNHFGFHPGRVLTTVGRFFRTLTQ